MQRLQFGLQFAPPPRKDRSLCQAPPLAVRIEFQLIRILIRDPPRPDQMIGHRAQRAIRCAVRRSLPNLSGDTDPALAFLIEQLEIVIGGNPGIHHDCWSIDSGSR